MHEVTTNGSHGSILPASVRVAVPPHRARNKGDRLNCHEIANLQFDATHTIMPLLEIAVTAYLSICRIAFAVPFSISKTTIVYDVCLVATRAYLGTAKRREALFRPVAPVV